MVWYTIDAATHRFTGFDMEMIESIGRHGYQVCVIFNKIDEINEIQLRDFEEQLNQALPGHQFFKLSTKSGAIQNFCQWDLLKAWSEGILYNNESLGQLEKFKKSIKDEDAFKEKAKYVEGGLGDKKKGPIAGIWDKVQALWRYVVSDKVPWYKKVLPLAGLVYLVSPVDAVPDFIPIVGLLDDAAVISLIVLQMGSILKNFEKQNGRK
jgi:uncharacterized membrane protein YkvA (DUF1232 family)